MSKVDWTGDHPAEEDRSERRAAMARALARGGMEDVQVISLETAETVLTPKRRQLIAALRTEPIESVRDLAQTVERDESQVSRDLGVLAEHSIIEYDESGRTKQPRLIQEHIIVEPL